MSYQALRGVYEQLVITALAPVPVYVDNQFVGDLDAEDEFGLVRVNFGLTSELTVGCGPLEFLRGSLVCEVYTKKGTGPGRGLELITPVARELCALNGVKATAGQTTVARVGQLVGPSQTALEGRPYHLTRLSAAIHGRYDGP